MNRYATAVEDGVLRLDGDDGGLDVGRMDDIVELVGGERYTIEYERETAEMAAWLDLDEDDTLTFEVRETITDMDFPEPFVQKLAAKDHAESPSERTEYFASVMQDIWDRKGNVDDGENPFV